MEYTVVYSSRKSIAICVKSDGSVIVKCPKYIDRKMADNFVNEKYTKYLMGVESLDTFDDYVKQLKDMGVDRALKIYQTAYDRVMK